MAQDPAQHPGDSTANDGVVTVAPLVGFPLQREGGHDLAAAAPAESFALPTLSPGVRRPVEVSPKVIALVVVGVGVLLAFLLGGFGLLGSSSTGDAVTPVQASAIRGDLGASATSVSFSGTGDDAKLEVVLNASGLGEANAGDFVRRLAGVQRVVNADAAGYTGPVEVTFVSGATPRVMSFRADDDLS